MVDDFPFFGHPAEFIIMDPHPFLIHSFCVRVPGFVRLSLPNSLSDLSGVPRTSPFLVVSFTVACTEFAPLRCPALRVEDLLVFLFGPHSTPSGFRVL